jgi:hypothetical protein
VTNFGMSAPGRTELGDPVARAGDDQPRTPVVRTTAPVAVIWKNVLLDSQTFVSVSLPVMSVIAYLASA